MSRRPFRARAWSARAAEGRVIVRSVRSGGLKSGGSAEASWQLIRQAVQQRMIELVMMMSFKDRQYVCRTVLTHVSCRSRARENAVWRVRAVAVGVCLSIRGLHER